MYRIFLSGQPLSVVYKKVKLKEVRKLVLRNLYNLSLRNRKSNCVIINGNKICILLPIMWAHMIKHTYTTLQLYLMWPSKQPGCAAGVFTLRLNKRTANL